MKKIGIVTLPLHFNYGGIMQTFALQEIIFALGMSPYVVVSRSHSLKGFVKSKLYSMSTVYKFVKKYIRRIDLEEPFSVDNLLEHGINTLVVGSDQVWRPCMGADRMTNVYRYFLKTDKPNLIRKVAYAVSFGVDYWDFTVNETQQAQRLVIDFSAISVRESSGIKLCSDYLHITNAVHVLDPTLLIEASKYKNILSTIPSKVIKNHCFIYLLDYNSETNKNAIKSILPANMKVLEARVERNLLKKYFNAKNSVEDWLASIFYSDLVITDSFHGCVFSILFHKDFFVMGNDIGGNARISSLLSLFHLQERFVDGKNAAKHLNAIDWNNVDRILQENREKSISFLKNALSND